MVIASSAAGVFTVAHQFALHGLFTCIFVCLMFSVTSLFLC